MIHSKLNLFFNTSKTTHRRNTTIIIHGDKNKSKQTLTLHFRLDCEIIKIKMIPETIKKTCVSIS